LAALHFEDSPVITCFVLHKRMAELEPGRYDGRGDLTPGSAL